MAIVQGNRETICADCEHLRVCKFKEQYFAFLKKQEELYYDGNFSDAEFIKKQDPECNFYKKKSEITFRGGNKDVKN